MPLKPVPPRQGKSPYWSIRGTYLGIYVDRSARTDRRSLVMRQIRELERRIERGEFPEKRTEPGAPTFLSAALAYLKARPQSRKRARYVGQLIAHFGETPLTAIDQQSADSAAIALYPGVTPASRNTYLYTPLSAILHHAGVNIVLARPKGAKGRVVTDHLDPPDAFAIIAAAEAFDRRFAMLLKFLLFTGCRLGEALAIRRREHVRLDERRVWIATSKNGEPRDVRLREDLCAALASYIGDDRDGRLFPFHQGGHMKHLLTRAKLGALGLSCPTRRPKGWRPPPHRFAFVNFHTFCHTWATWMRRYGGLDLQGLVATGRWRSAKSAARYAHVVAREEWARVERLPAETPAVAGGKPAETVREAG